MLDEPHHEGELPQARAHAPWRIGVDVGGTFTDLVLADARGNLALFKAPSVPSDPAQGVLNVLATAAEGLGLSVPSLLQNCSLFVHGSTVATNTILEGKGAKVGLITTAGHRDALDIRRGIRANQWDHRPPYEPVLVPRYLRVGVGGRLDRNGDELAPLAPADIHAGLQTFAEEGIEAIAVCLINSFRAPAHEQEVARLIEAEWRGQWVSVSSQIAPILGEYERTSTTVINAYLAPRVSSYLRALESRLRDLGLGQSLLLLQSNGGAVSVAQVADAPVRLVLSGPAAGVGALEFFRHANADGNLISMEIGGTSCDVLVMSGGRVPISEALSVGGYHVAIPSVEIHTVGAGGGTIARVDNAGLLTVGPQGAGARPGPACYGFGGEEPTVTDAQLVLGRLRPGPIADGSVTLDHDLAHAAIERHVATPLGLSVEVAAIGIVRLLEQHLLHAVERLSIQRGLNPSSFTLVAAGGAGPMHGVSVGRTLGCQKVFVPRYAGGFCALGLLASDVRQDYVQVHLQPLADIAPAALDTAFRPMLDRARQALEEGGFSSDRALVDRALDLRYRGQQSAIRVPLTGDFDANSVRTAFEAEHQRLYGHVQPASTVDVVNLRVVGRGLLPELKGREVAPARAAPKALDRRSVFLDEERGWAEVDVYKGSDLSPGHRLMGPLVVEEATTTLFVGTSCVVEVDHSNNYLAHLDEGTAV